MGGVGHAEIMACGRHASALAARRALNPVPPLRFVYSATAGMAPATETQ